MCPDGLVYNIEVERNHNYIANGVVVHNCHHAEANTYKRLAEQYPEAYHIGFTATPYRADGKGLGRSYDDMVVAATMQELIDHGYLVEPAAWSGSAPDLSGVRTLAGDYEHGALDAASNTVRLVGDIVETWQRLGGGQRTVVFAVSVRHSKAIVSRFLEAGIAAEHIDGTTPNRDEILARVDAGVTRVVSNCDVLTEGWDQPSVKTVILARPTKSLGVYMQQVGRILRPWNGVGAVILDHAGNVGRHGMPQDDREFTLADGVLTPEGRKSTHRMCAKCKLMYKRALQSCPGCGAVPPDWRPVVEVAGELAQVVPRGITPEQIAFIRRYRERGVPQRTVWGYFISRYGFKPPWSLCA